VRGRNTLTSPSVFKGAHAAPELFFNDVGPQPFDYPSIVVAVGKVVVQGREAVLLAGFLHAGKLPLIELRLVDISPSVSGAVHWEARRHRAVGPFNDVILAGAAVPFGELQFRHRAAARFPARRKAIRRGCRSHSFHRRSNHARPDQLRKTCEQAL